MTSSTTEDSSEQRIKLDSGEIIRIYGFNKNPLRSVLSWIGILVSLGMLKLLFHWFPKLEALFCYCRCDLRIGDKILVEEVYKSKHKSYQIRCVKTVSSTSDIDYHLERRPHQASKFIKTFTHKSIIYVLDGDKFAKLQGLGENLSANEIHSQPGLSKNQQTLKLSIYGPNEILVPLDGILQLVFLEIVSPFYVFQIFSFAVWICEMYLAFSVAIICLTVVGIASHVYDTRKNQRRLRQKVKFKDYVQVWRKGSDESERISTSDLAPGDIIQISKGHVYCDAILLTGSCLVDESTLTGESIPVLKTSLPKSSHYQFSESESSGYVIYSGTHVIQLNDDVKALVCKTSFLTSKGSLIRSVMYPKPVDYAFDADSTKCCIIVFVFGCLGAIYTVCRKVSRGIPTYDLVIKALDSITLLLPATLPVALTVGKLYALNRLKKEQIFCTNSKIANVAGSVDCICLDKTGTITNDKLEFLGAITQANNDFVDIKANPKLVQGMSVTHSLVTLDGLLQGDQIDVEMFKATASALGDGDKVLVRGDDDVFLILRRYHFVSSLQRMSVIVQDNWGSLQLFCKGSPEMILDLCSLSQMDLKILRSKLTDLSRKGCRVLAIGTKLLGSNREQVLDLKREELETDLEFLALLVFENKIKPDSRQVIEELKSGGMAVKMITGDNLETALCVAEQCAIVVSMDQVHQITFEDIKKHIFPLNQEYALTGPIWQYLMDNYPEQIDRILVKTPVFARMTSIQKQQVVEHLQCLEYNVLMCGDGTNDCGALKASLVGLSLAETSESSMAAPLTSHNTNLNCIVEVVREGRAALITIFGVFKIILAVNLGQFLSVMILFEIDASYTGSQFLLLDLHMLLFSTFMGSVKAQEGRLHPKAPTSSLLSAETLCSLIGFIVPTLFTQLLAYNLTVRQEWFEPYHYHKDDANNFYSYENNTVFVMALFQYAAMAIVFSKGKPYRKPIWTNWLLILSLILACALDLSISLSNWQGLIDLFSLRPPPRFDFRLLLLCLSLVQLVLVSISEEFLVDYVLVRKVLPKFSKVKRYETVLRDSDRSRRDYSSSNDNRGFSI